MKQVINVRVGEGESQKTVEAIVWIDETPPNCRRGKQQKRKNRRYKRQQQELIVERRRELLESLEH